MIVVSDNHGDRVEIGDTREELEKFLSATCSEDYAEQVLTWFDAGSADSLVLDQGDGTDGVIDTWVMTSDEDFDYEYYDDYDTSDNEDDDDEGEEKEAA